MRVGLLPAAELSAGCGRRRHVQDLSISGLRDTTCRSLPNRYRIVAPTVTQPALRTPCSLAVHHWLRTWAAAEGMENGDQKEARGLCRLQSDGVKVGQPK